MRMVLLRVGIDSGCGGMQGPLLLGGSFEYIPIPDYQHLDSRTYGQLAGRCGRSLSEYFPASRRVTMAQHPVHVDPEFDSFTYGDETTPKRSLRTLQPGDFLIFYCGLKGWGGCLEPEGLFIMGYFEVETAGIVSSFSEIQIERLFAKNFHVMHHDLFAESKSRLVLVKGTPNSRLLEKPVRISAVGQNRLGKPLKVLSPEMQQVFGQFGGRNSIQRSTPRWVSEAYVKSAVSFVRALR